MKKTCFPRSLFIQFFSFFTQKRPWKYSPFPTCQAKEKEKEENKWMWTSDKSLQHKPCQKL